MTTSATGSCAKAKNVQTIDRLPAMLRTHSRHGQKTSVPPVARVRIAREERDQPGAEDGDRLPVARPIDAKERGGQYGHQGEREAAAEHPDVRPQVRCGAWGNDSGGIEDWRLMIDD